MNNSQVRVWHSHVNPHNSRRLSILIVVLAIIFIPLSVYLAGQQQDIRQEAKGKKHVSHGKIVHPKKAKVKKGKIPGTILVKVKSTNDFSVQSTNIEKKVKKKHKGKVKKRFASIGWQTITVPPGEEEQTIADLKNDPNVETVEQDSYTTVLDVPNDPDFNLQYALQNTGQAVKDKNGNDLPGGTPGDDIDAVSAWDVTKGSPDTRIAVLDTGIDTSHPDLAGKVIESVKISASDTTEDKFGHGTHVAGIIAADANNNTDVAGICQKCSLLNIKVMNDDGTGSQSDMANGVLKAIELHADVINMSIGSPDDSNMLKNAIDQAISKGIVVVAAAGNCGVESDKCSGINDPMYPARYDNVLSVAATDRNDKKPSYSNYGSWVDVAAPGDAILSLFVGGDLSVQNGTSMATPMVSGLAGLLKSTQYGKTGAAIRNRIQNTADKIEGTGQYWKYGRINAASAVGASEDLTPEPTTKQQSKKGKKKSHNDDSGQQATPTPTPMTSEPTDTETTPTDTITPTISGDATPTLDPLAANLELTVFINGIGPGGDNAGLAGGNSTPIHPTRFVTAEIVGSDGNAVLNAQGELTYDEATGGFTGTIPLSNIQSGNYSIKIQSVGTLKKLVTGTFLLSPTKTVHLPSVILPIGDINGDNRVDILDFNILAGCYSVQDAAKSCPDFDSEEAADLNDDGHVDGFDYNLFVKNLTTLKGD